MTHIANDHSRIFEFGTFRIRVTYHHASLFCWLEEFFLPLAKVVAGPVADRDSHWTIVCDTNEARYAQLCQRSCGDSDQEVSCFTRDGHFLSFPKWTGELGESSEPREPREPREPAAIGVHDPHTKCLIFVDSVRQRVEIVHAGRQAMLRRMVMRTMRELATLNFMERGYLHLHGSCYARDGQATLFLGEKRAGKTTQLVQALACSSADFVANDRVLVSDNEIVGMSTIVSVRAETLRMFPSVGERHSNHRFHREYCLDEQQPDGPASDDAKITAAQFCKLTGANAVRSAPLGQIVFPQFLAQQARSVYIQLNVTQAAARIRQAILAPHATQCVPELFRPSFAQFEESRDQLDAACYRLADRVPCYQGLIGQHPAPVPGDSAYALGSPPVLRAA